MKTSIFDNRHRYKIFSMILIIALINAVDRGAISYASGHIMKEYGFDKAAWGAVLGYFGYGYMFGAVVGGWLSDHFGPKKMWLWCGLGWGAIEILTVFAGDIGMALFGGSALLGFAAMRIAFGLVEGPTYSVINKTMGNWASQKERSFAVSMGLLSTPLGALITAPIAVGLLVATDSWKIMFVVLGVAVILALIPFLKIFTDKPEKNPAVSSQELAEIQEGQERSNVAVQAQSDAPKVPIYAFFTNRTLVLNAIGYFAFMYVNYMLLTWTPKFLQDQFGFNLASLWYVGMIPWTGACITILLGGRISDWLLKKTKSLKIARGYFAAAALCCTSLCFLAVSQATNVVLVIALMTLGNALNSLVNTVYWTVVLDTAPSDRVGTFSGITMALANTASIIAPTLTGVLAAQYGYSAMFTATCMVTAVGMLAMIFVSPKKMHPLTA